MSAPTRQQYVEGLTTPAKLLYYAITSYVAVALETLLRHTRPLKLSSIRDEAFGRFWLKISRKSNLASAHPRPTTFITSISPRLQPLTFPEHPSKAPPRSYRRSSPTPRASSSTSGPARVYSSRTSLPPRGKSHRSTAPSPPASYIRTSARPPRRPA